MITLYNEQVKKYCLACKKWTKEIVADDGFLVCKHCLNENVQTLYLGDTA